MGLSRLDNFLKSTRGTILYVDPNSLDSTDNIENSGNSLTRPFKTLQRALIEAARFSYQRGTNNDRFGKTTILLYPGEHLVDNRPGWIPDETIGEGFFRLRNSNISSSFPEWDINTNFDVTTSDNALYKLNSVRGGIIVPRGTSIVGMDLRKTKIRPLYVPDPTADNIERSAILRLTGGCYLWQFTVLDADPNGICYKDYTDGQFVPNFSHHKLTAFEYADGVNNVTIDDEYISGSAGKFFRTDLEMYYEKVGLVYGQSSGREIPNDYFDTTVDIEPVVDEYRIVGARGGEVGITSIFSGNGVTPSTTVTVTLSDEIAGLNVDTPIQIQGVDINGYDGQFVISNVVSTSNPVQIQYKTQNAPSSAVSGVAGAIFRITVDTVTSASPYIFNISMRSVYGMCGLLADGSKADGFKSMIVSQFTGIGLQKDDNAFVLYSNGEYSKDSTNTLDLHSNSRSKFKPEYENFHIKATNDAYLQLVSVFAIGFAKHFAAESGGDISINNSNSNFGAKALYASGFKDDAFPRDDTGYITHIISPKQLETSDNSVEFIAIDVNKVIGIGLTNKLYLYNYTNQNDSPNNVIDGYRIGARPNDALKLQVFQNGVEAEYTARIIMPNTEFSSSEISAEKSLVIPKKPTNSSENNIVDGVITFNQAHNFSTGESVRVIADNGHLPDPIEPGRLYYTITTDVSVGLGSTQIKLAQTQSDAFRDLFITPSVKGGNLSIISRVSDKKSGDIGHPVQWDSAQSQWYINVSTDEDENTIYSSVVGLGTTVFGNATPRTYISRNTDNRSLTDTIYKFRYVIPKTSSVTARPPLDGYVIQEAGTSNSGIGTGVEIQKYFDINNVEELEVSTQLRNFRFISTCSWSSNTATVITELPHDLRVGSEVEIINVTSSNNTVGVADSGFNGTFFVNGVNNSKQFTYALSENPGTFTGNVNIRDSSLPRFVHKKLPGTYQVYRSQEIQQYIPNLQDGIYHLVVTNSSNIPTVTPFTDQKYNQPIQNLYPQLNRDNPNSDPEAARSFATPEVIGKVLINDPQKSITKETLQKSFIDLNVGFGVTDIVSNAAGIAHTFYTTIDHGFSAITSLSIVSSGTTYVTGTYYGVPLVGYAGSTIGQHATAVVKVSAAGTISAVKIMDGGSAYGIGNSLTITSIPRNTGSIQASFRVEKTTDNVNDALDLFGITNSNYDQYNNLYKISRVRVGRVKELEVISSEAITTPATSGTGSSLLQDAGIVPVGKVIGINTMTYDPTSGTATVGFNTSHGFQVGDKIKLTGSGVPIFNDNFIVKQVISNVSTASTQLTVSTGIVTTSSLTGGNVEVYDQYYTSNGGDILKEDENTSARLTASYAGITTVISSAITITSTESNPISIPNANTIGFNVGDYLLIDNEIFRIKKAVTSTSVFVFRGLLGSKRQSHSALSVVRKINIKPIEFHRNSIIRASGHTFEYIGFGPGNYSTSLPEKQDRIISPQEEIIAQATKENGGIVIFTGMNSDGDFYTGNKKINSATGQEELFDAPIPTVTGEDPGENIVNIGFDVITPLEISVNRSIRVEGGPDSNIISEFDGPVLFNNKITSTSSKGIEANSLYLQGDAKVSRKMTVGISTPTIAGNTGDYVTRAQPNSGSYFGWVYTTKNRWEKFGIIGNDGSEPGSGVGISSNGNYVGFSTLINVVGLGVSVTIETNNSINGITTITIDDNPMVAISTGSFNTLLGSAKQLNFIGAGITVSTIDPTGIVTITMEKVNISGLGPADNYNTFQYHQDNDTFAGLDYFIYNNTTDNVEISDVNFTRSGRVSLGSANPSSKFEIHSDTERSIYINSTTGSGEIVRIDSSFGDTAPFIIDVLGSVGINTTTVLSGISFDTVGNAGITGELRFYKGNRLNYAGFKVSSGISENLIWTLPTVAGVAGSVMYSISPGILGWASPNQILSLSNTDYLPEGSINKYFLDQRAVLAVANAIGELCNIDVAYNPATGRIDYKVGINTDIPGAYPFTTRGFSMPI
jgi:hypothetical protein